jgi:Apea-like HEPN
VADREGTLKRKIQGRAKLITNIVKDKFPELDMVVDQAVNCRNYYVHGSPAKFDYGKHIDHVHFFTDTLEFVFAASDLLEAG